MPLYEYGCLSCRTRDIRVAGLDDHAALCVACGGIMVRLAEDIFQAYFTPDLDAPSKIMRTRLREGQGKTPGKSRS